MLEHPKSVSARKAVQAIGDAAAGGTQTIDRAATLLLLVGRAGPTGARLTDLVEQCGLTKPTIRRMLLALVRAGLLDQDPDTRRYHIGPEIYVLGTLASTRFGIHPISLRSLVRLSQDTGDTAFLSVPRDVYSICVHREEGPYPIRIHALHAGTVTPWESGPGASPCCRRCRTTRWSKSWPRTRRSWPRTIPSTRRRYCARSSSETRAKGYALNPGMLLPGSWGIGVAIRGADGRLIGALSIAAIESRLGELRQREIGALLKREAAWIETRLGEAGTAERPSKGKAR